MCTKLWSNLQCLLWWKTNLKWLIWFIYSIYRHIVNHQILMKIFNLHSAVYGWVIGVSNMTSLIWITVLLNDDIGNNASTWFGLINTQRHRKYSFQTLHCCSLAITAKHWFDSGLVHNVSSTSECFYGQYGKLNFLGNDRSCTQDGDRNEQRIQLTCTWNCLLSLHTVY